MKSAKLIAHMLSTGLMAFCVLANAYDDKVTHPDLSEAAQSKSLIDSDATFLPRLGFRPWTGSPVPKQITANLRNGSQAEDFGIRSLNHFFDPIHDQPLNLGGVPVLFAQKSPDFALETDSSYQPNGQEYLYRDAQYYFYQALTEKDADTRGWLWGKTFFALGHVIHHIQDMGQPQHVRNDMHCSEYVCGFLQNPSRYEAFTKDLSIRPLVQGYANGPDAASVYSSGSPGPFNVPRDFWTKEGKWGLVDYTNKNFVSQGKDSNFLDAGGLALPSINYDQPTPGGHFDVKLTALYADPRYQVLGGSVPKEISDFCGDTCFITFYSTTTSDGRFIEKASSYSIFDQDLRLRGQNVQYTDNYTGNPYFTDFIFTLNKFNFLDVYPFIIPKTVGYSAGLINYFFRGTLEISAPDEFAYSVIDPTKDDRFKTLKLKVQNTTPNENMTGGTIVAVARFHRNMCYRSDLTGEGNGPNAPDIVACRSQVEEIAPSAEQPATLASGAQPIEFTFDFSSTPIPVNATDLFIQVVYRGPLGAEQEAVAVGMKDLYEPTHIGFLNTTDYTGINGTFYSFDQIKTGIESGDPTFSIVDANHDKQYKSPPDLAVDPLLLTNVKINFRTSNGLMPLGTITSEPAGRFSRFTVLTDQSFVPLRIDYQFMYDGTTFSDYLLGNRTSAVNQLDDAGTLFYFTGVTKLRDLYYTDAEIIFQSYGTPESNVLTVPASSVQDATVPVPVTTDWK